jgi:hypothetical protein
LVVHSVTEERGVATEVSVNASPTIEPVDRDRLHAIGFARTASSPRVVPADVRHTTLAFR